jgi:hypothetical protein
VRGYGYWAWKPHIINKKLISIEDEDYLLYIDAGCRINRHGQERFKQYIDMISSCGLLTFKMKYPEVAYSKQDTLKRLGFHGNEKVL